MLIIPAIDIKDGRCVRLFQGDMGRETVYFEKPLEAAKHWRKGGATLLHIVDLNGAVEGRPVHVREVEAICKETGLLVELGGGLRSVASVEAALSLGVSWVVIGTAAYENPDFLPTLCKSFPEKIVVGIDARQGKVAVKGWQQTTPLDAVELARRCEADGVSRIIYTDISRDGTSQGVNVDETRRIAGSVRLPIIASGGVATLGDIGRLAALEKEGIEGVIVGRALYSGAFTLADAIQVAAGSE